MRLHAYLTQALVPGNSTLKAAQIPGVSLSEAPGLQSSESTDFSAAVASLSKSESSSLPDAQKALQRLGQTEIVDASFKVIGERVATPSSFVNLVVKLRVAPFDNDGHVVEIPKDNKDTEKRDNEFLVGKKDMEDLPGDDVNAGSYAHAPYWPAVSYSIKFIRNSSLQSLRTASPLGGSSLPTSSQTRSSSRL